MTAIYLPGPANNDSTQHHLVPDAVVRGNMLFTGGIAGFDSAGRLPETHEDQAALVYDRVGSILDAAGFSWDEVGHWFIWAPDRHSRIGPINPHWERRFPDIHSRPARHALARQLGPGVHYRIELIAVKNAQRRSYEISDRVYHTGGTETPGFMPFGTTMAQSLPEALEGHSADIMFTGPTYGMYAATRKMGETPYKQAELCFESNQALYDLSGHSLDNMAQMFVWYHDAASRDAAIRFTDATFPNKQDRPAIHYIYSQLPYWPDPEVQGQFLIQYDIIGVRGRTRKVIDVPGITTMDSAPAGVAMDGLCFTSVVLGEGSLEQQTASAFRNALSVVDAGGFTPTEVGHVYVWYTDHAARETVDKVWAELFPRREDRPTRHCVVADLPEGSLVGVEFTAAR